MNAEMTPRPEATEPPKEVSFGRQLNAAAENYDRNGLTPEDLPHLEALEEQLTTTGGYARTLDDGDSSGRYRGPNNEKVSQRSAQTVHNIVREAHEQRAREAAYDRVTKFMEQPGSEFAAGPDIKNGTGLSREDILHLGFGSFGDLKKAATAWKAEHEDPEPVVAARAHADAWNAEREAYRTGKEAAATRIGELTSIARIRGAGEIGEKRIPGEAERNRQRAIEQAKAEGHAVDSLEPPSNVISFPETRAARRTKELVALLKEHDAAVLRATKPAETNEYSNQASAPQPTSDPSVNAIPNGRDESVNEAQGEDGRRELALTTSDGGRDPWWLSPVERERSAPADPVTDSSAAALAPPDPFEQRYDLPPLVLKVSPSHNSSTTDVAPTPHTLATRRAPSPITAAPSVLQRRPRVPVPSSSMHAASADRSIFEGMNTYTGDRAAQEIAEELWGYLSPYDRKEILGQSPLDLSDGLRGYLSDLMTDYGPQPKDTVAEKFGYIANATDDDKERIFTALLANAHNWKGNKYSFELGSKGKFKRFIGRAGRMVIGSLSRK